MHACMHACMHAYIHTYECNNTNKSPPPDPADPAPPTQQCENVGGRSRAGSASRHAVLVLDVRENSSAILFCFAEVFLAWLNLFGT